MTDSKFCEHGVNVGLKNPSVFCGQCPPDTIESLRAQLAEVTGERDEARALLDRIVRYHDEDRAVTPGCTRLVRVIAEAKAWLPGGDKEPEGFCACGRRTSECDRSRKACTSESR